MQCVILFMCFVSSTQISTAYKFGNSKTNFIKRIRRNTPISEKLMDTTVKVQAVTMQTTETSIVWRSGDDEFNPCNRPLISKPDFSAPNRRISETKCYEYIWEIQYREDIEDRLHACDNFISTLDCLRKIHRGFTIPKSTSITEHHPKLSKRFYVGGRNAEAGEFPHMGAIGWKATVGTWIFKCGSTLISNKFVLTAAHCSRGTSIDRSIADVVPKIVRLGDKNIIDVWANGIFPNDVNILKIIVHPQYKAPKKYFDIALMELEKEVQFNRNVQPACLWRSFNTSSLGEQAIASGWGVINTAGKITSPILQVGTLDIIDSRQCDALLKRSRHRNWYGLVDTQICAGKLSGGSDTCQGDSGGPLQVPIFPSLNNEAAMHHVIGVTSFGVGCAVANVPGVYTRVSSFIDWIEDIVWR